MSNYKARAQAETLAYELASRTGLAAVFGFDQYTNPVISLGTLAAGAQGAVVRFLNQMGGDVAAGDSGSLFQNIIGQVQPGYTQGKVEIVVEGLGKAATANAFATGTLAPRTVANTNTCVIGPVTITFVTSGATADTATTAQINIDAGATPNAANAALLAAKINSHATLKQLVSAAVTGSGESAVLVTITSKYPGIIGNQIALAGTVTTLAASGTTLGVGAGMTVGAGGNRGTVLDAGTLAKIVSQMAVTGMDVIVKYTDSGTAPSMTATGGTAVAIIPANKWYPGFAA